MSSLRSLISQGRQFYDSRDYYNAYKTFEKAYKMFPDHEEVLLWKGKTEIKLGKLKTAINTLRKIVEGYNKDSWEALYTLALAIYYYSFLLASSSSRKKNLKVALDYSERAYTNSKKNKSEIASLRSVIIAELGQLGEAEKSLAVVRRGNNFNPPVSIALTHIYRLKGLLTEAIYEIDRVLLYEPNNVDALIERALVLRDKGTYDQALVTLDIALQTEPTNVLAMLFKAEVLETIGKTNEAMALYKVIDSIVSSPLIKKKLSTSQPKSLPSKLLSTSAPINWDPKVWVGKKLSIYEVTDVLGEGGNGYVLKAKTPKGNDVAVKVLKIYTGVPEEHFDTLISEANSLSKLSSDPNVVKVYAVHVDKFLIEEVLAGNFTFYKREPPMLVMEFMRGGNMAELMHDDKFFYSTQWNKAVYRAIASVASALYQMHKLGLVHMDVKPQNIFLTEKPNYPYDLQNVKFKLGDLGSVVRVNGKVLQLTVEYASPEAYLENAKPYFDVFSLGMTMYVLLTRKLDRPDLQEMNNAYNCYQRKDFNCVRDEVRKAQGKLRGWDPNVPAEVKPLLASMISPDPVRRPTSLEVHNFLLKLLR